jgi:hypothetical protein
MQINIDGSEPSMSTDELYSEESEARKRRRPLVWVELALWDIVLTSLRMAATAAR